VDCEGTTTSEEQWRPCEYELGDGAKRSCKISAPKVMLSKSTENPQAKEGNDATEQCGTLMAIPEFFIATRFSSEAAGSPKHRAWCLHNKQILTTRELCIFSSGVGAFLKTSSWLEVPSLVEASEEAISSGGKASLAEGGLVAEVSQHSWCCIRAPWRLCCCNSLCRCKWTSGRRTLCLWPRCDSLPRSGVGTGNL